MILSGEKRIYLRNLIFSYLPHFAQVLVSVIIIPMLVKVFGKEGYGVYVLLYTILGYFALTDIGLPQTIIREIIHAREKGDTDKIDKIINSVLFFYSAVVMGVVLISYVLFYRDAAGIVGILIRDSRFTGIFRTGIMIVVLSFAANIFNGIFESVIYSENKVHVVKLIKFIQIVLTGAVTYLLLRATGNPIAVITGRTCVSVLIVILSAVVSRNVFRYRMDPGLKDWTTFRAMVPSSFWYLMSGISVLLIFQVDNLVISSVIGLSSVAVYAVMFRFTDFARQILSIIPNTLFPKVAKMFSEKKHSEIRELHNKVLAGMLVLSVLAGILLYYPGYGIFKWWIGAENAGSIDIFVIFIVFSVLFSINQVSGLFLGAIGYHRNGVIVGLLQGAVNLFLSIVLARIIGIKGVIMATVISLILTNLWFNPYYFYRVIKNENSGT